MKIVIRSILFSLLLFYSFVLKASVPDTILLHEVKVIEKLIVQKNQAGLKFQKIDTLMLANLSHLSLSEVLTENTPIFIKTYGRGSMATASFRGTAASHTKVLWNDMEINSPMLGMVDFSLIPIWFIDDVNLSYGAAAVNKSSGAMGGSIELSNKANWHKGISVHTLSSLGSYESYDQFAAINYSNRKLSGKTKIFYSESANNFSFYNKDIPANVDLQTGEISYNMQKQEDADYKKYGFLQEVYYKLSMKDVLSFKIWNQFSKRSLPQLSTNETKDYDSDSKALLNNYNKQIDKSTRIATDWKHYADNYKIKLNLGYINTSLDYFLDISQFIGKKTIINRTIDSKSRVTTYSAKLKLEGNIIQQTKYTLKGEFVRNSVDTKEKIKKTGYKEDENREALCLFVQHKWSSKWSQTLSIRAPFIKEKADPLVYVNALEYNTGVKNRFKASASISRNHKRPSLNDLYFQPGGNPNLLSEKGYTYEGNVGYNLIGENINFDISATVYKSDINNWIIWLPNERGYWEPFNIRTVNVRGFECKASLKGNIDKDFHYRIMTNYAITKSINNGDGLTLGDLSIGKQLPYIPVHSSNILCGLEYKDWFTNYNYTYYSERFTTTANDRKNEEVKSYLYPYYMSSISVGKRFLITKKCLAELKFKVENLLNEDYVSMLQRPMPRRNFTLLLDLKF